MGLEKLDPDKVANIPAARRPLSLRDGCFSALSLSLTEGLVVKERWWRGEMVVVVTPGLSFRGLLKRLEVTIAELKVMALVMLAGDALRRKVKGLRRIVLLIVVVVAGPTPTLGVLVLVEVLVGSVVS